MGCASLHNNGVLAESSRCETMKSLLEISGKKMTNSLGAFFGGSEWANEQLVKRMKLMG